MNFTKWFKDEDVPTSREHEEVKELKKQIIEQNQIIEKYTKSTLLFLDDVFDTPQYRTWLNNFNQLCYNDFYGNLYFDMVNETYEAFKNKNPIIALEIVELRKRNKILSNNYGKLKSVFENMEKMYEDKWQEAHNVTRVKELEDQVKCYESQINYLEDENKRLRMRL